MRSVVLVAALFLCLSTAPGQAGGGLRTRAPIFNVVGETIPIILENKSDEPIEMTRAWNIFAARSESNVPIATYHWTAEEATIPPGDKRVWKWAQHAGCFGACDQPFVGDRVMPGPYRVQVESVVRSHIGQFFQVGFDHLEGETFTVFVNRADDIEAMTAEAAAEDKTQMVTGIVRDARRYNSPWEFTMGPGSIILAEVSVEVCDADPYYVQDHKRSWMGERWCPWSSYVAAVGR